MIIDFVSLILGALLTTGVFSIIMIRDTMRPQGRRGRREAL